MSISFSCVGAEYKDALMKLSKWKVRLVFIEVFGKGCGASQDKELMCYALGYHHLIDVLEKNTLEIPNVYYTKMVLFKNGEVKKIQKNFPPMLWNRKKGEEKMEKDIKKINKVREFVLYLFSLKKFPKDADIIARVQKKFPKSSFNEKNLAVYKSKARKGILKGQENPIAIPRKKRTSKSKEK